MQAKSGPEPIFLVLWFYFSVCC